MSLVEGEKEIYGDCILIRYWLIMVWKLGLG